MGYGYLTKLILLAGLTDVCAQVIVEKVQGARIPDLDRKKYLVPGDLTGKWSISKLSWLSM